MMARLETDASCVDSALEERTSNVSPELLIDTHQARSRRSSEHCNSIEAGTINKQKKGTITIVRLLTREALLAIPLQAHY